MKSRGALTFISRQGFCELLQSPQRLVKHGVEDVNLTIRQLQVFGRRAEWDLQCHVFCGAVENTPFVSFFRTGSSGRMVVRLS